MMNALTHCTICSAKNPTFTTHQFRFGDRDVTFCGSCWHHLKGVVNVPDEETQVAHRLIDELRGVRRIVINACYGGFSLSHAARLRYLELRGIGFSLRDRGDKHSTSAFGPVIMVGDVMWGEDSLSRDDPTLVRVVQEMGVEANGRCTELKIVPIPADVDWRVVNYNGREWVVEKHRTWH